MLNLYTFLFDKYCQVFHKHFTHKSPLTFLHHLEILWIDPERQCLKKIDFVWLFDVLVKLQLPSPLYIFLSQ